MNFVLDDAVSFKEIILIDCKKYAFRKNSSKAFISL